MTKCKCVNKLNILSLRITQAGKAIFRRGKKYPLENSLHDDNTIITRMIFVVIIENLTCPVCFHLFKNPKFLPCHHSYCEECLEKMQVESKITCPECRYEATVPKGGVNDLPTNFFINRIMDELGLKHREEDELKCDECVENEPVVAYCMDCKSNLCQFCCENHKRSKRFHSHNIVSIINRRLNKNVTIEPKAMALMCKEHDLELLLFCETCEQLVCKHCVAKGHNDHDYANARMKVCKCQVELEKVTTSTEGVAKNVSKVQDTTDKTKKVSKVFLCVCLV